MDLQDIYILNPLDKAVHVVAFGNHFNLKPKQIKLFRGEIGRFLDSNKGYLGLIALSDQFGDHEWANSDEGKAELEKKTQEGVNRYITWLQGRVNNLQVSLASDLVAADIKAPIETQATDGDLEAMDELLHYQRQQRDENKARTEAARVRLRQISASQNAMVNQPKKEQ